jgi:hypothetical protein
MKLDQKEPQTTPLTRTQEEIVARIREIQPVDFFGWEATDLLAYLSFELAKPFLKDDATAEEWAEADKPFTRESVVAEIVEYMPFAWDKANDQRGISANRSISHMRAWTWLLNDGTYEKMEALEYQHYRKEKLISFCESMGLDWKQWYDGERTNG